MITKGKNWRVTGSRGDRMVMAVASLVIITLVKVVRAGREHLLAGETRPGQERSRPSFWSGRVIVSHAAHLFKGALDI